MKADVPIRPYGTKELVTAFADEDKIMNNTKDWLVLEKESVGEGKGWGGVGFLSGYSQVFSKTLWDEKACHSFEMEDIKNM